MPRRDPRYQGPRWARSIAAVVFGPVRLMLDRAGSLRTMPDHNLVRSWFGRDYLRRISRHWLYSGGPKRTTAVHSGSAKPLMIAFLSFDTCAVYWRNLTHGDATRLNDRRRCRGE